jgi:hypothetical protein
MTVTGLAFKMQYELRHLMKQHDGNRVHLAVTVPLSPPVDDDVVELDGLAYHRPRPYACQIPWLGVQQQMPVLLEGQLSACRLLGRRDVEA